MDVVREPQTCLSICFRIHFQQPATSGEVLDPTGPIRITSSVRSSFGVAVGRPHSSRKASFWAAHYRRILFMSELVHSGL